LYFSDERLTLLTCPLYLTLTLSLFLTQDSPLRNWVHQRAHNAALFSSLVLGLEQPAASSLSHSELFTFLTSSVVPSANVDADSTKPSSTTSQGFQTSRELSREEQQQLELIVQENFRCEEYFFKTVVVDLLQKAGKLEQALSFVDDFVDPLGGSDFLLRQIIESCSDKANAWKYILRIRDKEVAAGLVMKWINLWNVEICLDLLDMCKCQLQGETPIKQTVTVLFTQMSLYRDILRSLDQQQQTEDNKNITWDKWQTIHQVSSKDPTELVRTLVKHKYYELARRAAHIFNIPNVKNEIEENHVMDVLLKQTDDSSAALQALMSMGDGAIPIAESLIEKVDKNTTKLFLVQYLLGNLGDEPTNNPTNSSKPTNTNTTAFNSGQPLLSGRLYSIETLRKKELGLQVSMRLSEEMQQRYQLLVDHPGLIIESLIMEERITEVAQLFRDLPQLRDDTLVILYAKKALSFAQQQQQQQQKQASPSSSSSFSSSTPGAPSPTPGGPLEKEKKRHYELNTNILISNTTVNTPPITDIWSLLPSFNMNLDPEMSSGGSGSSKTSFVAKNVPLSFRTFNSLLNGEPQHDKRVRQSHSYVGAPSINLCKVLFDLCGDGKKAGDACLTLCDDLSQRLAGNEDHLFVINLIKQLLTYAKFQFIKDPNSSSGTVLCDSFLGHVELLQSLLISKCPVTVSLKDFSDKKKVRQLRDKLIAEDLMKLATEVASKCGIEAEPVWASWGLQLLKMGRYTEAKEKFVFCLTEVQEKSNSVSSAGEMGIDSNQLLKSIISILEFGNPVDSKTLREVAVLPLRKITDRAAGGTGRNSTAQVYAQALRTSLGVRRGAPHQSSPGVGVQPSASTRSNLDSNRYMQCIYYLKRYGSSKALVAFWTRHYLLEDACRFIFCNHLSTSVFLEEVVTFCLARDMMGKLKEALKKIGVCPLLTPLTLILTPPFSPL
jgi:zinc finger FYVE domain-containing protein 26